MSLTMIDNHSNPVVEERKPQEQLKDLGGVVPSPISSNPG